MDWSQLGESIAKMGLPALGTALGGVPGAAIGKMLASALFPNDPDKHTPDAIAQALAGDPEALKAAREFELREKQMILESNVAIYKSETERLQAVNATMQSEGKSEHWLQWSWRPAFGYVTAFAFLEVVTAVTFMFCNAIINKQADALTQLPTLVNTFAVLFGIPGAILGVASWHRGRVKLADALGDNWGTNKKADDK